MKTTQLLPIPALSVLALVTLLSAPSVHGQTIALTGWNQDLIAEASAANPGAGTSTSIAGFYFYENGAPSSTQGLPTGGAFTSSYGSNLGFQLQPYGGGVNNAVLVANSNATVTLTAPAAYQSLQFLVSGQGNGGGPVWTATLNFADIAPVVLGPTNTPDWTAGGPNVALSNVGLAIGGGSWGSYYAGPLDLYEFDFTVPLLDQTHVLNSITLTETTGQNLMFFGLDGTATPLAAPEPSTWALMAGGAALLFVINRRRLNA